MSSFFFNHTAAAEIYTLSLHDALPISSSAGGSAGRSSSVSPGTPTWCRPTIPPRIPGSPRLRSEEHTSELQSREKLVCRLLLEKKKAHDPLRPHAPNHPQHHDTAAAHP